MIDSEKIKTRIIETARKSFAKYGYKRVKTSDISKETGISKRTLYEHFPSKEALFQSVINDTHIKLEKDISAVLDRIVNDDKSDFVEELANLIKVNVDCSSTFTKEFYEDIEKLSPDSWNMITKFREIQLKSMFFKIYEIGENRGIFKPGLNYELVYLIKYFAFNKIVTPDILATLPLTTKEVIESIIKVLFTGILTDEGNKKYTEFNQ